MSRSSPWPIQTQFSSPPAHVVKRKLSVSERRPNLKKIARATIENETQIDSAKVACFNIDNSVTSCWPTSGTGLDQNEATQFIWNSKQPSFAQFNLVNIGLFRADTGAMITSVTNYPNPTNRAGSFPITAGDDWWGTNGAAWNGKNITLPFYFAIVANGTDVRSGIPQATFTATQTTFANSILASMSSTSAAAVSASLAAQSSLEASKTLSNSVAGSGTADRGTGLQNSSSATSFPHWAIAVIVVLGFFALSALIALIFLAIARTRRRRIESLSRRASMGSQSPMMAEMHGSEALSPQTAPGLVPNPAAVGKAPSFVSRDGASTHSDSPFSGADAAVMAEAFRKALRKPEFADHVEESEGLEGLQEPGLLDRELAEEGRDLRSVSSSRGVRVETLSDTGEASIVRDNQI